ncbi:tyrosine-type recombinase/integrase [Rhizorhapis sp. SPR117]|uniref:tyrosine-type recombinase/integrase n=1 Tax=Rhizorhapis sp. SPR117 TaxID=2912611 RepID=UPI001F2A2BDC|nr:site-specific integrase [Rhizorhapis sp. SPR117]
MASDSSKFIIDKEELKPGLILFRRSDVKHRNWYCRVKVPKEDRYKTVSLKTQDLNAARALAWDQDGEVRYAIKHGVALFNRPFRDVAKEFLAKEQVRAKRGEITAKRCETIKIIIEGPLDEYIGSVQVHLIADERWGDYPSWRRENGEGRIERNGSRMVSAEVAARMVTADFARRSKGQVTRRIRPKPVTQEQFDAAVQAKMAKPVPYVSDDTIRMEMKLFSAIMNFAVKKRYVPASHRFDDLPALKTMHREEFTVEEYRKLHTVGRAWVKAATTESSKWHRTMTYNMVLVACNTGMRPPELKNLRWRDVWPAKDREGRDIFVLFVQGKGKSRKLVAPKSVGDYLERIRSISRATEPDDRVFTTITGQPAITLYKSLIGDLLTEASLRKGADGTVRTTYSFRHTYATFRLQMGVDVYFLAEQMGTSVQMIEKHYGHVNTIKHADRVLVGMEGWDPVTVNPDEGLASGKAKASKAAATRDKTARPAPSKPRGQRNRPR